MTQGHDGASRTSRPKVQGIGSAAETAALEQALCWSAFQRVGLLRNYLVRHDVPHCGRRVQVAGHAVYAAINRPAARAATLGTAKLDGHVVHRGDLDGEVIQTRVAEVEALDVTRCEVDDDTHRDRLVGGSHWESRRACAG